MTSYNIIEKPRKQGFLRSLYFIILSLKMVESIGNFTNLANEHFDGQNHEKVAILGII